MSPKHGFEGNWIISLGIFWEACFSPKKSYLYLLSSTFAFASENVLFTKPNNLLRQPESLQLFNVNYKWISPTHESRHQLTAWRCGGIHICLFLFFPIFFHSLDSLACFENQHVEPASTHMRATRAYQRPKLKPSVNNEKNKTKAERSGNSRDKFFSILRNSEAKCLQVVAGRIAANTFSASVLWFSCICCCFRVIKRSSTKRSLRMRNPRLYGRPLLTSAKWKASIRQFSSSRSYRITATMRTGSMSLSISRSSRIGPTGRIRRPAIIMWERSSGTGSIFISSNRLTRRASLLSTAVSHPVSDLSPYLTIISVSVKSNGLFEITDLNNQDTLVSETIKYQCPPFLGSFCRKEVEFQRKKIMYNIAYHFSQQQKL